MFTLLSRLGKLSLRSSKANKSNSFVRKPSPPLGVEPLEDRITPADGGGAQTLSATLIYHNGPLIPNVQIQPIFLQDTQTLQTSAYQAQLDGFFNTIISDSYIPTLLGPYSVPGYAIGTGSVGQDDVNVPITPISANGGVPMINDSQIQSVINGEIQSGNVPSPNGNTLYFVFTPPGDEVVNNRTGQNSIQNFAGYHSYYSSANGSEIYYTVVCDPGYPNRTLGTLFTPFQQLTSTSSHEMAEAITDPSGHGWYISDQSNPAIPEGGEIGDLVGPQTYTQDGYAVQYMWSNALQGPVQAPGTSGANLVINQLMPPSLDSFAGGPVATFTDTDPTLNASDFVAEVNFGDGNGLRFATVTGGANGVYTVVAKPASPLADGGYGSPFSKNGMVVYVLDNQGGEADRGGPLSYRFAPYVVESSNPVAEFFTEVSTAQSRFFQALDEDLTQLEEDVAAVTTAFSSQLNNASANALAEMQYMNLINAAEWRFYAVLIQSVDQFYVALYAAEAKLVSHLMTHP